jgi:hypothetical protein
MVGWRTSREQNVNSAGFALARENIFGSFSAPLADPGREPSHLLLTDNRPIKHLETPLQSSSDVGEND